MDDRWETVTAVLVNVAYTVAVLVMVAVAVPSLRAGVQTLGSRQVHAWRYGRWLQGRRRPPAWTQLLTREDLPAERS